jgi:signal transduction histidine kinase
MSSQPDTPAALARAREAASNVSLSETARRRRLKSTRFRYSALLRRYLIKPDEDVLAKVYELGREAIQAEIGLLVLSDIHHDALRTMIGTGSRNTDAAQTVGRASTVFSELIAPLGMQVQANRQANIAMQHINEMLEDEVRRIALSLHDEAGQFLACVHIALHEIAKQVPTRVRPRIDETRAMLDDLEEELRRISHELRPKLLERSGLAAAVDFLADGVSRRTGLDIAVSVDLPDARPPPVLEAAIYRCIQELLTNISKHAQAHKAWIAIGAEDSRLSCEIRDDGVGFDAQEVMVRDSGGGLGLHGILERIAVLGGDVEIESEPGSGARVLIEVPVP